MYSVYIAISGVVVSLCRVLRSSSLHCRLGKEESGKDGGRGREGGRKRETQRFADTSSLELRGYELHDHSMAKLQ
jgi:hypothetical protein